VPLDGFKTQILLLHSEQSTLDNLSSGFGDSYTVHCATSGSEALNTLVDTPINVIVTAQELPGMSGLDALREAKKRSPDTIGILLAGNADDGLEALVSDKEVFQVVRGSVTADSISKLVENATQQMRLMTLANSANDAAADVDEPAEHIVMETSENGSTIISDGTGRMPILDPTKVSAVSAVGSHSVDLLVLTNDKEFLATIKDSSRGTHTVHYADTLAQADKLIRKHKVGVAVVDAAMVGEKIEQLTAHLRKGSPRLVSIVAGRRDDGEMMMDLINRSKVYRFLLKPVSPGRARLAVEASVKHHLEAPDGAFQMKRTAPPATPKAEPPTKQAPKPASKPEQKLEQAAASQKLVAEDPPLGSAGSSEAESINDDALSEAFGGGDSSFAETVTNLFNTVSKKLSSDEDQPPRQLGSNSSKSESAVAAASTDGSFVKYPKMLGLGAAAVIVIAGTLFWFLSGTDDSVPAAEPDAETPAITAADADAEIEAPATNANTDATDVGALVDQALVDAELALLESRIDDASAALQVVGASDPDNARLPFLTAQLSQLQLRVHLTDAREAIREARFEDAITALGAARSLGLTDSVEIDTVENELTEARSAQQADDVLALANARLDDGDLLAPPNDNARYYFELALSNDPENVAARQGLSVIASKLALQARSETDNGNLDAAEGLIVDANALDPDNSELAAAIAALADKRDTIAEERRQAEARRRAEEEKQAADARAAAEREAEKEREAALAASIALAATTQPVAEAVELPAEEPASENTDETTASEAAAIDQSLDSVQSANPDADATADMDETQAEKTDADESPSAASNMAPTAVSALKRTKYVAPKYPRAAQRRNLSGWVDVVFTVDRGGQVKAVEVRNSEPGDTFVASAIKAVEKWEFEPVIENGEVAEKRAAVRLMFALE
jgi:TonB family protein